MSFNHTLPESIYIYIIYTFDLFEYVYFYILYIDMCVYWVASWMQDISAEIQRIHQPLPVLDLLLPATSSDLDEQLRQHISQRKAKD